MNTPEIGSHPPSINVSIVWLDDIDSLKFISLSRYTTMPIPTQVNNPVSINDKIRFTKELFEGNSQQYNDAVNTLNNCEDLDKALKYLNENFSWDQDKESFREFLELIYRRFINL